MGNKEKQRLKDLQIANQLTIALQIFIALLTSGMLFLFGIFKKNWIMGLCGILLVVYSVIAKYIIRLNQTQNHTS
jgi:hypothetical protein